MNNEYYEKFLKILKETKGIHNSLNEILKYDFIYNSNKIEGSTFTNAYGKKYSYRNSYIR